MTLDRGSLEALLEKGPYDFVLMDPPYPDPFPAAVVERMVDRGLLAEGGIVVVGHASRVPPPSRCGGLALSQDRRYGDSSLAFYEVAVAAGDGHAEKAT